MATTKEQIESYTYTQQKETRASDPQVWLRRLKRKFGSPPVKTLSKKQKKEGWL